MKSNWRSLLGELLMIVVGILIALGLNDWSQDRRDRRAELKLLRQMHAALAADVQDNRTDYEFFRDARARIEGVERVLSELRPYSPGQDSLFGALLGTRVLQVNAGPYDVLRARGFELLTNDSLRSQIAHYYGTTVPFMTMRYARVDNFVQNYAAPYYFKHFVGGDRTGTRAKPVSFPFITHDPEFRNLVTWQLNDLEIMMSSYDGALKEGSKLVDAVAKQVRELE
jgi:hypothetical protein